MAGNGMFPSHMPMPTDQEINNFLRPKIDPEWNASEPEVDQFLKEKADEDKYGGVAGALKTAALGAADSATLGLSNLALTKTGLVSPETIEGLEKTNPASHFAGEVAGVFAPTGVAGAVGKIGKIGATAAGLGRVFEAEQAVQEAMKLGHGLKAATAELNAVPTLSKIGGHALGSAIEGSLYAGVQGTVNEMALGDPDLNAEKVMANFGHGALYGGALGGALKAAAIGAPPALKAAKEALVDLRDATIGTGVGGDTGLIGKIAPESDFVKALGNRTTNRGADQQAQILNEVTNKLNRAHNNIQTSVKNLNESLRPQEVAAKIDSANPMRVMDAVGEIREAMKNTVQVMKSKPAIFSSNAAAKLEDHVEQLENNMIKWGEADAFSGKKIPSSVFEELKDIKQSVANWGHGIVDVTKGDTKQALTDLSGLISSRLKDPEIFGDVGSRYAKHDEVLHDMYQFIGPNGKPTPKLAPLMTNSGTRANPRWEFDSTKIGKMYKQAEQTAGQMKMKNLNEYYDLMNQLPDHLEATHANVPNDISFSADELRDMIETSKGTTSELKDKYLGAVKSGKSSAFNDKLALGVGALHPWLGAAMFAHNVFTQPFSHANSLAELEHMIGKVDNSLTKGAKAVFTPSLKAIGKTKGVLSSEFTKDSVEEHKKIKDELSQLNNNPSYHVDKLGDATAQLSTVAPQMAGGLQDSMIRANQFLQSKLPPTESSNPFDPTPEPSRSELANFNRYRQIVEDPKIAFDQIRNGTIGPETVETLSVVYPRLYQQMKSHLMDVMTDKLASKEQVPYQLKQSISFFFQQPLDRALQGQSILANQQAMIANQIQAQPQGSKPSKQGMQKMTVADRTGVQRSREDA